MRAASELVAALRAGLGGRDGGIWGGGRASISRAVPKLAQKFAAQHGQFFIISS